jgi:hypothetical protein
MAFQDNMNHEQWARYLQEACVLGTSNGSQGQREMGDVLEMQKTEANANFAKFIYRNYESWLNDPKADKPIDVSSIDETKVFPTCEEPCL